MLLKVLKGWGFFLLTLLGVALFGLWLVWPMLVWGESVGAIAATIGIFVLTVSAIFATTETR